MKIFFLSILLLPVLSIQAQKKANPVSFAKTITPEDLKKHLYTIASKEMEGRGTPSPGLDRAAGYIENHFRSLGLLPGNKNSYLQTYPLYKDSMLSSALKVNDVSFELNKDYQPSAMFNYTADMRFSEAVFAGYGIVDGPMDDYKDLDVQGKLIVIVDGAPADYKPSVTGFRSPAFWYTKYGNAQKRGAAAIILVASGFPRKAAPINNQYSLYGYKKELPANLFTVSPAVAESILGSDGKNLFDKMKTSAIAKKVYPANVDLSYSKATSMAYASNVLGVLEGTDLKDEYVFITGHYDHLGKKDSVIYYGADDDGSGTTTVLELAAAFAKAKAAGKGPRRTMVFMTVSGEEKGLWGSEYYTDHPLFPLDKTTVDLNVDMVGRIDDTRKHGDSTNYVYVVGDDKVSTDLKTISEAVNKKYTKVELDYKFNDPKDPEKIYFRSDHYNFAKHGVPIIFYYDGMLDADYHQPTDTPDKINYKLMAKRGQLIFHTAWEMANRDAMLKRDIPLEAPKGF
ncbi:MAG: M28 family peptidase [Bacteroidetes bacterium]|nr:M28 family peptidase [Bacteroidota bacterium]